MFTMEKPLNPYTPPLESLVRQLTNASRLSAANIAQVLQIPLSSSSSTTRSISAQDASPTSCRVVYLTPRHRFLVFARVMLKYLDKSKAISLKIRAKKIIAKGVRRNRANDANYIPLANALEERLYKCLGERHWTRANACFDAYCAKQRIQVICCTTNRDADSVQEV